MTWPQFRLTFETREFNDLKDQLGRLLAELHASTQQSSGEESSKDGTFKLELLRVQEEALDDAAVCRWREGFQRLSLGCSTWRLNSLRVAWKQWSEFIRFENNDKMEHDRSQWLLHAKARQDDDLQAWYHSLFRNELYRLKGPFWYKEAALQEYKNHPIKKASADDTPASVLCTPDMTYATMAATMYTIRAKLDDEQYALFEKLTSDGVHVMKHPRSGRPQKKLFQLSLVQGDMYLFMYLTWKGKHGTQGVELASVMKVESGMNTDVLKRNGKAAKDDCYLSLVLPDRSLDLRFEGWHYPNALLNPVP